MVMRQKTIIMNENERSIPHVDDLVILVECELEENMYIGIIVYQK